MFKKLLEKYSWTIASEVAQITLVIDSYDRALSYYIEILNFILLENTDLGEGKRWVVVTANPKSGERFLLARATDTKQAAVIGNQSGGRVFIFLYTNDFDRDYQKFLRRGVKFIESPRLEKYGKVVVFKDLYGNKFDLMEQPDKASLVLSFIQQVWTKAIGILRPTI